MLKGIFVKVTSKYKLLNITVLLKTDEIFLNRVRMYELLIFWYDLIRKEFHHSDN